MTGVSLVSLTVHHVPSSPLHPHPHPQIPHAAGGEDVMFRRLAHRLDISTVAIRSAPHRTALIFGHGLPLHGIRVFD